MISPAAFSRRDRARTLGRTRSGNRVAGRPGRLVRAATVKACLCGVLLFAACGDTARKIPTQEVSRGEFVNRITVTGELEAVNSKVVTAPALSWRIGTLKIVKLVDDGSRVEEGQVITEFDKTDVQKSLADAEGELEIARAELRKAQTNHASVETTAEIDLEIARINLESAKLKLEQAAFEADIDRKQKEFDLEKAAIDLEKAEQDLENKRRVNREEISKLELNVEQVETKLTEARNSLEMMTVTAPNPGIAIVQRSWMTGAKWQVNDQPYANWPLVGLPDLSNMRAKVQVNEVDIAKIRVDQPVEVRLDADADSTYTGHITTVAALARPKNRNSSVKVFDVEANLDQSGGRLLPGMTVRCDIIAERLPDTLSIPLDAVFEVDGATVAYIKNGSGFEPRPVTLGSRSDDRVLVASGLAEGDEVALGDPTLNLEAVSAEAAARSDDENR